MSCGLTISISTQLLAFGIRTESQGFANPKTSPRPSWITPFEPGRFRSHDFLLLRVLLDFLQRGTKLKARGIETVILACLTSQTHIEGTRRPAIEAGYHLTFL